MLEKDSKQGEDAKANHVADPNGNIQLGLGVVAEEEEKEDWLKKKAGSA